MDIDLLSKMVMELILDNDEVTLPGVGTFVAEVVPSSFSDRGYTINPPYRRLSFRQRDSSENKLIELYAMSNRLDQQMASSILMNFLKEMKEILLSKKTIVFPGLGRLRATKENTIFFVPDENLNIYPEGFGLEPISLKTHVETSDEIQTAVESLESLLSSDSPAIVDDTGEDGFEDAELIEIELVEEVPSAVPEEAPADAIVDAPEMEPVKETGRGMHPALKWSIAVLSAAAILLALFLVMAHIAPDFTDSLLYTKEELELIRSFQL